MDALTASLEALEITEGSLSHKDLSAGKMFFQSSEKNFNELTFEKVVWFSYYLGKVVIRVYFELSAALSYNDTYKLTKEIEETFCKSRKLRRLDWCANYVQDKTNNDSYSFYNFIYANHSPNRRQENNSVEFELCKCTFCKLHENEDFELFSKS